MEEGWYWVTGALGLGWAGSVGSERPSRREALWRRWFSSGCGLFGRPSEGRGFEGTRRPDSCRMLVVRGPRVFVRAGPGVSAFGTRSCWAGDGH